MPIESKHPQYKINKTFWDKCQDTYDGEQTVKAKGTTYTPKLSGQSDGAYKAYVERGALFGIVEKTVSLLVGMLLSKTPIIKVPAGMEYILDDFDGCGLSLNEFIKEIAKNIILTNRFGVLLDRKEDESVYARGYTAAQIFNWIENNNKDLLAVTLDDSAYMPTAKDPYEQVLMEKIRELKFIESGESEVVEANIYTKNTKGEFEITSSVVPSTLGIPFEKIPFTFINAQGSSTKILKPFLLDMVNMVLSQWKNSVDLEHGLHWVAIPTAWIAGLTIAPTVAPDAQDGAKETVFNIGGENAWLLPEGASTGYLEFSGAGLDAIEKRMDKKEKQITMMGSRILEAQKKGTESAETARINKMGDSASLLTISTAIESGLRNMLRDAAVMERLNPEEVSVELNKDFIDAKIDPATIKALLDSYNSEAISLGTFIYNLKNGEYLPEDITIEDEKALIEQGILDRGLDIPGV